MSSGGDNKKTAIVWLPHDAGRDEEDGEPYAMEGVPFTTFGVGSHAGNADLVYVPGITGPEYSDDDPEHRNPWGLDPEMADLIIALNKAGIETVQSCQEISTYAMVDFDDPDDRGVYGDLPRMGIVVVKWEAFLRLTKSLPGAAAGSNFDDGWLFAADREAEYISVIFPWRDYEAWLASARELVRGLRDDSCTVSETR